MKSALDDTVFGPEIQVSARETIRTAERTKLEQIAAPICASHGVRLVSLRFGRERGGAVLRVLIEREGAYARQDVGALVTVEDCQAVSRDLSTAIDVHELDLGSYSLEVSSPGLERPLFDLSDFERFQGREVRVETKHPLDFAPSSRRKFSGVLLGTSGPLTPNPSPLPHPTTPDSHGRRVVPLVRLRIEGEEIDIPFDAIREAHLVYHFASPKRAKKPSRVKT